MKNKVFLSLAVALVSLLGLLQTGLQHSSVYLSKVAGTEAASLTDNETVFRSRSLKKTVEEVYHSWRRVEPLAMFHPNAMYRLGRAALVMSRAVDPIDQKIEFVCQSLHYFHRAAKMSPRNPGFQIALADMQHQIPHPERVCRNAGVNLPTAYKHSAEERLEIANELAPYSVNDLYFSAIVYLGMQRKPEALRLLRMTQEINPLFTGAQREYAYDLVTSRDDLEHVLPRRYPEIVYWLKHFAAERPNDYTAWHDTFAAALLDAIAELENRYRTGKLDSFYLSSFFKSIGRLPLTSSSEALRKRLDLILADVYRTEGKERWAELLSQREKLERLPVLKSVIIDDISPKSTMLFGWMHDQEMRAVSLDSLGRSLGFYVPQGAELQLVVLESVSSGARIEADDIELLASSDNLRFHPLRGDFELKSFLVNGRERIAIEIFEPNFRFLKIRYTGAEREPKFYNHLQTLVQAYGRITS